MNNTARKEDSTPDLYVAPNESYERQKEMWHPTEAVYAAYLKREAALAVVNIFVRHNDPGTTLHSTSTLLEAYRMAREAHPVAYRAFLDERKQARAREWRVKLRELEAAARARDEREAKLKAAGVTTKASMAAFVANGKEK